MEPESAHETAPAPAHKPKAIATAIAEALQAKTITDRIETLLSVKAEANDSFDKAARREKKKGFWFTVGSVLVACAGAAAAAAASWPLWIVACVFSAGGCAMAEKATNHHADINKCRDTLNDKIGGEVSKLADSNPQEAVKSPRFLKALKESFNLVSASEAEVQQLLAFFLFGAACPGNAGATAKPTP